MGLKKYHYMLVSPKQFRDIEENYKNFIERVGDPNLKPVRVFSPLPQKILDELYLIRELSKGLQLKKIEDMNKAAKAAQEAEESAQKEEEEKKNKEVEA